MPLSTSMIILVKSFSASRHSERTMKRFQFFRSGRKMPENCSRENPQSQVGTEKPNPHSAHHRDGRRGKTPYLTSHLFIFFFVNNLCLLKKIQVLKTKIIQYLFLQVPEGTSGVKISSMIALLVAEGEDHTAVEMPGETETPKQAETVADGPIEGVSDTTQFSSMRHSVGKDG